MASFFSIQAAAFSPSPRPPRLLCAQPHGHEVADLSPSSKLKIAVLGFGNLGQFLAEAFLRQGHAVLAHSRSSTADHLAAAESLGAAFFPDPHDLCEQHPDVVLLSTSLAAAKAALRSLPLQSLRRSTLFADALAVKEFPREMLLEALPHHFDILCTHPMLSDATWRDAPFVFEKVRVGDEESRVARVEAFLDIFEKEGCRMVEMSCVAHDRHAAATQLVARTVGRMLEKLRPESTPIDTKGYEALCGLEESMAGDRFHSYIDLFMYNKNAMEQLERLDLAFDTLKNELFGLLA